MAADILIQPALGGIDMLSFKAFDTAIEAGYRATKEAIPRLRRPLMLPPLLARSAA
jgi:NTE family protein